MKARTLEEIQDTIDEINISSVISMANNQHMYEEKDGTVTIFNPLTAASIRAILDRFDPNREMFPTCGAMPYLDYMVISKHDFDNLVDFCLCLKL